MEPCSESDANRIVALLVFMSAEPVRGLEHPFELSNGSVGLSMKFIGRKKPETWYSKYV
jgi:hypothetical protein